MNPLSTNDFDWDGYSWVAKLCFPSWIGFHSRGGAYGSQESSDPSNGTISLTFAPEGRDDSALSEKELELVRWVVENESATQQSLLSGLLERYPTLREEYAGFLGDVDTQMPEVTNVDDFRGLIGLHAVHVHQVQSRGLPYMGFELGCTWDPEHGLGVLMHGTRVVEIGGADTAFLLWIAKRDARSD